MTSRRSLMARAGFGVLATLLGLGAAHLVAALLDPATSPVVAVGTTVIDLVPTPMTEWAIATFGTADKPILLVSVTLVTLALAALAGVLTRWSRIAATALMVLLVLAAASAAVVRPQSGLSAAVPAVVAAITGITTLLWLTAGVDQRERQQDAPAKDGAEPTQKPPIQLSRRGVLGTAAVAAAFAATGQVIGSLRDWAIDVVLPRPDEALPPLPQGWESELSGLSPLQTPNELFYRIDINLVVPRVQADDWTLRIDGDVDREVTLTYRDLTAMRLVERDITLNCVSNEVGGPLVSSARWLGVPLREVLDLAGVGSNADQILSTAVDGFTISTPLQLALDGRDTLVAIGMNGEPLPREHGFPVRLVTPGLYGYVGSTKWLTGLTLTTYAAQEAYWTERGWSIDGPVKLSSKIDLPAPGQSLAAGPTYLAGVAWAQHTGISAVEVRIDDGEWQPADLGHDLGIDYWCQWRLRWEATPGRHRVAVRAIDADGLTQTAERVPPFPDGSTGIQELSVLVD